MSDVANLISQLHGFNSTDLRRIATAAKFLIKTEDHSPSDDPLDLATSIFMEEMRSSGFSIKRAQITGSMQYAALKDAVELTEHWFEKCGMVNLRKTQRRKLYQIAWRRLIKSFREREKPLTVPHLLASFKSAPQMIDNAFPGYAAAGLLPVILHFNQDNRPRLRIHSS